MQNAQLYSLYPLSAQFNYHHLVSEPTLGGKDRRDGLTPRTIHAGMGFCPTLNLLGSIEALLI